MNNETEDLSRTLAWACGAIQQTLSKDRQRIALAYREAQDLVAGIPKDNGDARPRILACFERSDAYRTAGDIACVGWVLTAIQERVNERNLHGWEILKAAVEKAIEQLPCPDTTVH